MLQFIVLKKPTNIFLNQKSVNYYFLFVFKIFIFKNFGKQLLESFSKKIYMLDQI